MADVHVIQCTGRGCVQVVQMRSDPLVDEERLFLLPFYHVPR